MTILKLVVETEYNFRENKMLLSGTNICRTCLTCDMIHCLYDDNTNYYFIMSGNIILR